MARFPLTSKYLLFLCLGQCVSSNDREVMHGTIAYPFGSETKPLGLNQNREKFVIRSIVGKTEYIVEIPGGGEDYDIEVPLAEIDNSKDDLGQTKDNLASAISTDRELTSAFPQISDKKPTQTKFLDKVFGLGQKDVPSQSQSYSLGLAKINDLYQKHKFEYTLIEINNLLAEYPNSAKLYKMKGTVLLKMGQHDLAEKAWTKAVEFDPSDATLHKGLEKLQNRGSLAVKEPKPIPQVVNEGPAPTIEQIPAPASLSEPR